MAHAFVSVRVHPHVHFSIQQPFIRRGVMNVFQLKEENKNRDPIQLFHSVQRRIQYIPLCAQDRAPAYSTLPKKKKTHYKRKKGRGLFSFRALSNVTGRMKRV